MIFSRYMESMKWEKQTPQQEVKEEEIRHSMNMGMFGGMTTSPIIYTKTQNLSSKPQSLQTPVRKI